MKTQKPINIIGGGIAGLATALGLQSKGINYRIFEKNPAITYENVGFGISSNIFPILDEWGILEETKTIGATIDTIHFVDEKLRRIKSFKFKEPPLSVNRKKFYQLILKRLEAENIFLNTEKKLADFNETEIVIAAEGIDSKSRKKWYPNLKIRDSKQVLWRGITKIELDKAFTNSYYDLVGNNLRFAIIDTGNSFYSWYIIKQTDTTTTSKYSREELVNLFQDYHPIVREIIQKSEDIFFSELRDIAPRDRNSLSWSNKNALLIGDAIHPTTPNMANGGCLAIEDAYLLAQLLEDDHIDFEKFRQLRIQKVNAVVRQSWLLGKLLHQKNKTMDSIMKLAFSIIPGFLFDRINATVLTKTKSK